MDLPYGRPLSNKAELKNLSSIDLLARMIYGEARGESLEGMRGVAFVAYNRKDHSRFPNSLSSVLLEGRFVGLSSPAGLAPDTNSDSWKKSLDIALKMPNLSNPIGNLLWFNATKTFEKILKENGGKYKFGNTGTAVAVKNKKVIGNHTFFIVEGF